MKEALLPVDIVVGHERLDAKLNTVIYLILRIPVYFHIKDLRITKF